MEPLLVHPDPVGPELQRAIELGGWTWNAVGAVDDASDRSWAGAIVVLDPDDPEPQLSFARGLNAVEGRPRLPVLVLVRGHHLGMLADYLDVVDGICVDPFHPVEFEVRVRHLLSLTPRDAGAGIEQPEHVIAYGPLVLNLETYQALSDGRPLDLTYMEYELLRFLASSPGRVFTRETLLSQVWGYEYYGGARTVDVHIRRLRSKLGEEHAALISTVRSVGYRFGESRWDR